MVLIEFSEFNYPKKLKIKMIAVFEHDTSCERKQDVTQCQEETSNRENL